MASCAFAVNKQNSLDIIGKIIATQPVIDEENQFDIPLYSHKLAVIELSLDKHSDETKYTCRDINTCYERVIAHSYVDKSDDDCTGGFNWAPDIDIAALKIDGDKIVLHEVFLHGTTFECDWSNITFTYDEHLKTWINPSVIDDGIVMILDFRQYFE